MFVASLVSKFVSFFSSNVQLLWCRDKWMGHQAGVLLDQYSRRSAARRFRLLEYFKCWTVESELGQEESGHMQGVVATNDQKKKKKVVSMK